MAASFAGDIAKLALKRGLIKCQGKTPEATMASALYTDVKRKESNSVFIRPHEGLFGLREWADKGLVFKVRPTNAGHHAGLAGQGSGHFCPAPSGPLRSTDTSAPVRLPCLPCRAVWQSFGTIHC